VTRKEKVLRLIDRKGLGVEIGPSHDPIAPKREGFNVHVIDHVPREQLLAKYASEPVNLANIEEVDFIWSGQPYAELTGRPGQYDWVIGSHLVEHTPDLIAFLEDCDSLLKPEGVLVLVIPDKRLCFDRFRPITGLARVIDAHQSRSRLHTAGAVAEYMMNVVARGTLGGWDAATRDEYRFYHTPQDALESMRLVTEERRYLDIHNWCFVPSSFRLMMEDLHTLGMTKLREAAFEPTEGFEFIVTLSRGGKGTGIARIDLLRMIDAELAGTDVPMEVPQTPKRWWGRRK
jgi:SAM-dependent methyltransferase